MQKVCRFRLYIERLESPSPRQDADTGFAILPVAGRVRAHRGHCCILGSCVGSAYMGGQP